MSNRFSVDRAPRDGWERQRAYWWLCEQYGILSAAVPSDRARAVLDQLDEFYRDDFAPSTLMADRRVIDFLWDMLTEGAQYAYDVHEATTSRLIDCDGTAPVDMGDGPDVVAYVRYIGAQVRPHCVCRPRPEHVEVCRCGCRCGDEVMPPRRGSGCP